MKDLKVFVPLLLALYVVRATYEVFSSNVVRHVFINESSDHRFDESIRTSILAAQMRTGVQNAVLITSCLESAVGIEGQSAEAFRKLSLGKFNAGRAILYYFCPEQKSLKIEVGYGLEAVVPDVIVHQLEQAAKAFIFTDRYQDFWAELINTLNIEIQLREKGTLDKEAIDFSKSSFQFFSGGAGVSSASYAATWDQYRKETSKTDLKELKKFAARQNLDLSLHTYLESLLQGLGEPELDILTQESRFFRGQILMTNYQMIRNGRMYQRAGVDRIFREGSLAFVFFRLGNPVLPIVLRLEDGKWRVHEPFSWSLFQRFEDTNKVFFKYPLQGFSAEMQRYIAARFSKPLFPLTNPLQVKDLARRQPVFKNFSSYLIHLYWLDKVEKELASMDLSQLPADDLAFAADAFMNLGQMSLFLKAFELLASKEGRNAELKANLEFYRKVLVFKDSEWVLTR